MKNYQIEIKWAIIFSVVLILWCFIEKILGLHGPRIEQHQLFSMFYIIPAIVLYFLAILEKRNKYFLGKASFKKLFFTGFLITIFISILNPLNQFIIHNLISPEFFQNLIAYSVKTNAMNQNEAENYFNLLNYILISLPFSFFVGIFTSIVAALVLKK